MSPAPLPEPTRTQRLLRRADQATVAALVAFGLAALAWHWWALGGQSGRLIEIDHVDPLSAEFKIDVNIADWPEFATLPDVGETTARRIVEYRQRNGAFQSLDDLRQVRGIGAKTMERLRPYFLPISPPTVAEQ
jgi:competence ComEA-like helix-hairpin-helix protein